jgi:hypothetical protein
MPHFENVIGRLAAATAALLLGLACAATPRPVEFEGGADGPDTADGLYRVRSWQVSRAFVKPGADFSAYHQVVIDPVSVSYEFNSRSLSPEKVERLEGILQDAFRKAVERSQAFRVASEPGPRTLRVSARIVNLKVRAPAPPSTGGERSFVLDAGEMTLILDTRDSQTGAPLARIADRRIVRPSSAGIQGGYQNIPVNNWGAVRELASRWARILREGLDNLHQIPVPPAPGPADQALRLLPSVPAQAASSIPSSSRSPAPRAGSSVLDDRATPSRNSNELRNS